MSKSILFHFLVISLVLLLGLHGVPVQGQPPWKLCPRHLKLPGTCPSDHGEAAAECAIEIMNDYGGAMSMPTYCTCRQMGSDQRMCRCKIRCSD
ncbi:hypothetical protein MLD38_027267 [Melastoma candidum]|uniref:Uncharacterized protein n=1 Tax=Melastoma candidum TaxID=119954 RepID=A0ACB9P119_9MYRT|nr:hypothetical protein MLD38_027267 [Melastoma candidum]